MYCAWKVNAYEVNEFKRNIIVNLDSFSLFQLILALNSPPLLFRFIFRFWAEIYNFLSWFSQLWEVFTPLNFPFFFNFSRTYCRCESYILRLFLIYSKCLLIDLVVLSIIFCFSLIFWHINTSFFVSESRDLFVGDGTSSALYWHFSYLF